MPVGDVLVTILASLLFFSPVSVRFNRRVGIINLEGKVSCILAALDCQGIDKNVGGLGGTILLATL